MGSSGLGSVSVSGISRVPSPPARMTAWNSAFPAPIAASDDMLAGRSRTREMQSLRIPPECAPKATPHRPQALQRAVLPQWAAQGHGGAPVEVQGWRHVVAGGAAQAPAAQAAPGAARTHAAVPSVLEGPLCGGGRGRGGATFHRRCAHGHGDVGCGARRALKGVPGRCGEATRPSALRGAVDAVRGASSDRARPLDRATLTRSACAARSGWWMCRATCLRRRTTRAAGWCSPGRWARAASSSPAVARPCAATRTDSTCAPLTPGCQEVCARVRTRRAGGANARTGSRSDRRGHQPMTVLDCVWVEDSQTYYVMDMLMWKVRVCVWGGGVSARTSL